MKSRQGRPARKDHPKNARSSPNLVPFPPVVELPPEWEFPEPGSAKARVLSAARELFAANGLEGTSIRDITAAAGVNSAMVNYYFRRKDELYRRVLGYEILGVFRTLREQIDSQHSPGELLMRLPLQMMRVVRSNPIWARLLSREIAAGAVHLQRVIADLEDVGPLGILPQAQSIYQQAVTRKQVRDLPGLNVIQFLIVLGYSGVFYNSFFRVIGHNDPDDEPVFEERLRVFETLIRNGLQTGDKPK